jgi:DNA adenine methylase
MVALSNKVAAPVTPFLRWAGSKRRQLPQLAGRVNISFTRYIEPFAGSACLFFHLQPRAGVLGDKNRELIALYRCVRDNPLRLHRRLAGIPRDSDTYYRWRSLDPDQLDSEDRALRFLYLNRNCFNGIYRTNVAGRFNVPFGRDVGRFLTRVQLLACATALRRVSLVSGDFEETLARVQRGDFVYLDPPFAVSGRRVFRQYDEAPFSTDDVPRLGKQLRRISRVGAKFLVSYADCREARELAAEWASRKIQVRRHVAGFVGDRARAYEWLITDTPSMLATD